MRIGDYEVQGELGRGGMGAVYRARAKDGRTVALKLLARAAPGAARERFERERRLLASLGEADGFVPLLDAGVEKGHPFLVMPLLEGGTLRDRLKKGALRVPEAIALAEALALALSRAHAKGIVHRDMKPENIIFTGGEGARAGGGRPLVADLGLAKHFDVDAVGASQSIALSRSGQLLGTAGYMAPEQARDARAAGPPADVFALGAILYECLAGWPAFEGGSLLEVLQKVEGERPPPVANVRPETPPWLAAVVERALARDPAARYPDGAALLGAVRRRDAGAAPGGRTGLRAAAARRALFAAPALAAVALLVLAVLRAPRAPEEGAERPAAATAASDARPADDSPEARIAQARARLEGTAVATSALAPPELLAEGTPAASRLRAAAARRAVLYALPDAERLRALFPGERAASVLWGIAALGAAPDIRARGEEVLDAASEDGLARALARLARVVDGVIAPSAAPEISGSRRRLPALLEYLRPLAAAPDESVDASVAPLAELMVAHGLGHDREGRITADLVVAIGLADASVAQWHLPPRLRRAWLVLGANLAPGWAVERARAAESVALEASDALTRALALSEAVANFDVAWERSALPDREACERDGRELERLLARLAPDPAVAPTDLRHLRFGMRRVAWMRALGGTGERAGELARGIALARDAIRADASDVHAAKDLVRFLLESGFEDVTELQSVSEHTPRFTEEPDGMVLALEVNRRSGRTNDTLITIDTMFQSTDGRALHSSFYAVRALALADERRFDEARAMVSELRGRQEWRPLLSSLSADAVERYIDERAKR